MKDKKSLYKTASVPVGNITETFEKYLKQGKDILSISISSALSTTYNETMMVADELMKKYPGRTIKCVDSLRYSTALAYLVCMASDKRKSGATLGETFEYIESTGKDNSIRPGTYEIPECSTYAQIADIITTRKK
jgi:fatty acid-binding protein DegV